MSNSVASESATLVEAMLSIENTSRTVENIRSTSLAMRKLAAISSEEHDDMLVSFCFGLLTVNFAPLWNDACAVLKTICDRSGAKIWDLAFSRLTTDEDGSEEVSDNVKDGKANNEIYADQIWNESQQDLTTRVQRLYDEVQCHLLLC